MPLPLVWSFGVVGVELTSKLERKDEMSSALDFDLVERWTEEPAARMLLNRNVSGRSRRRGSGRKEHVRGGENELHG